jgi:S1-C subfamily serine protease
MKKIILFLCLVCVSGLTSIFAQSTYNPAVASQSNSTHNVWGVRCYKDKTLVFLECAASRFRDSSFSISSHTTLTSNNGNLQLKIKSWGMYDAENNITTQRDFDKLYTVDAGSYNIYVMEFETIPLGIENISVQENIPNGFFWRGIQIKNSAKLEDVQGSQGKPSSTGRESSPPSNQSSEEWVGSGSGFFISRIGHIATNYHVVDGMTKFQVEYYQNGKKYTYPAKVISSDPSNDMAIIRVDHKDFTTIPEIPYKFDTKTKEVGTDVFTLGYPLTFLMGEEIKYTRGEISAKSGFQGDIRAYQISVPITNGNSGGPLFDYDGNIVGITSSGLRKDIADNVNYAIKSIYLQTLIDACQENIELPTGIDLTGKSKPEIIKALQGFVVLIKVK